jgi:dihydrodipicolinate synthase/N-acetylneuraminate lyase
MTATGVIAGVYCPLVTPFDHLEDLYLPKLLHNISRLNSVALAGYIAGSVIGEGGMLTFEERSRLYEAAASASRESAKPKVLIAATCEASVRGCLRDIEKAAEFGYTAAIVETANGFLRSCVADRSPLPVISQPVHAPPAANAIPYAYVTVFEAERTREFEAAEDWRRRLKPCEEIVARYGVPAVKAAMDRYGFFGGAPRLPGVRLRAAAREEVAAVFADIKS